jgi:hypothetical protein
MNSGIGNLYIKKDTGGRRYMPSLKKYKTWNYWYFFDENNVKHSCRSSLEALYLMHLRSSNIGFQYEPTTFDLSNGCKYTPDVYLVAEDFYVEVKGHKRVDKRQDYNRYLCEKEHGIKIVVLKEKDILNLMGLPKELRYYLYHSYKYQMEKCDFIHCHFDTKIFDNMGIKKLYRYCPYCKSEFQLPPPGGANTHWKSYKSKKSWGYFCRVSHSIDKRGNQSLESYLKHKYRVISHRCNDKNSIGYKNYKGKLHITKDDFISWGLKTLPDFLKQVGIDKPYKKGVSVDKINDELGYAQGNLQWMMVTDNIKKMVSKRHKPVLQYDLNGNFVQEFKCMSDVAKLGISQGGVSMCCNDKLSKFSGYIWKFKKKEGDLE